jgi:hypothetical protein
MKKCSKCKIEKPLNEFHKVLSNKDGKSFYCKPCASIRNSNHYLNNKEKIKAHHKPYNIKNIEPRKEAVKRWQKKNGKQYLTCKRQNNTQFKLTENLRSLIGQTFKRACQNKYKKGKKTEQILGCTIEEFIIHLQSHFKSGMTLENHGQGAGKWNIDHVTPISSAKTEEEIYKLNHHTNLQPLWWEENMAKGAKKELNS